MPRKGVQLVIATTSDVLYDSSSASVQSVIYCPANYYRLSLLRSHDSFIRAHGIFKAVLGNTDLIILSRVVYIRHFVVTEFKTLSYI